MTSSQIISMGVPTKQWTTLEYMFNYINFQSDSGLFLIPKGMQLYFDTDNELLFIRRTNGFPRLLTAKNPDLKNREVKVEHSENGKLNEYAIKLSDGGFEDKTIGVFHEVVCFQEITCMSNLKY